MQSSEIVRRLLLLICSVVVVATFIYIRMNIETRGDRIAVSREIIALGDRFRQDPTDVDALNELVRYLNGTWSFARTCACVAIGDLGPSARGAIPDLIRALNCGNGYVEREAAIALGKVAIGIPDAVQPLMSRLSENSEVAYFSAEALGKIGRPAFIAIPALEKAAESQNESMRYLATNALISLKKLRDGGK